MFRIFPIVYLSLRNNSFSFSFGKANIFWIKKKASLLKASRHEESSLDPFYLSLFLSLVERSALRREATAQHFLGSGGVPRIFETNREGTESGPNERCPEGFRRRGAAQSAWDKE